MSLLRVVSPGKYLRLLCGTETQRLPLRSCRRMFVVPAWGARNHMQQAFTNHPLAGPLAISADVDFLDVVTDYFGYVALVSVAVAVVILSLGFSANVAVGFLDRLVKPAFFATETLAVPALAKKPAGAWHTTTRAAD